MELSSDDITRNNNPTSRTSSSDLTTSSSTSLGPYVQGRRSRVKDHGGPVRDSDGGHRKTITGSEVRKKINTTWTRSPYLEPQISRKMTRSNCSSVVQMRKGHQGSGGNRSSKLNTRPLVSSSATSRLATSSSSTQLCVICLRFMGCRPSSAVEGLVGRSHQVSIFQQHSGGNPVSVYRGHVQRGDTFTFTSKRHHGFPFSIIAYVDSILYLRLSGCCEYKYRVGSVLGGPKGHFALVSVTGSSPCFKCHIRKGLFLTKALHEGVNVDKKQESSDDESGDDDEDQQNNASSDYEDDFEDNEVNDDVQNEPTEDIETVSSADVQLDEPQEVQVNESVMEFENFEDAVCHPCSDEGAKDLPQLDEKAVLVQFASDDPAQCGNSNGMVDLAEGSGDDQKIHSLDTSNDEAELSLKSTSAESGILDSEASNDMQHRAKSEPVFVPEEPVRGAIGEAGPFKVWTDYRDGIQNYDSSDEEENDVVCVASRLVTVTADVHAVSSPRNEVLTSNLGGLAT